MCVCVCPCELVNVCDAACTAVSDVLRLSVCIPSRINLWLQLSCQRAGTRVSQAGESAGLALFCWWRGGTSEAPGPPGTSLPSPPDRLGASGLRQHLWPPQTFDLYDESGTGVDWIRGRENKSLGAKYCLQSCEKYTLPIRSSVWLKKMHCRYWPMSSVLFFCNSISLIIF